ncbi:SusC/RagA family TonB-linked outer membrane protein [Gynurincola endophyticus]|jgi:TonB-linked SusC/RagA family outer membrane protein|uniref:SusC/RagA family TonB-linked outer membrane protein n=1 Tax=Gynurincola endophyticus TaxID=2479004 RepID=UPI000F8E556A|nr:TonB-dependent receptor [Gynurincola endophyticus]
MKQTVELPNYCRSKSAFSKPLLLIIALLFQCTLLTQTLSAQNISVSGQVVDESGNPVSFASIVVSGATGGVQSDEKGNFTLTVAPNAVLSISAAGFASQDVRVEGKTTLKITLKLQAALDQVVVVGYGTQRKKDVTGSIVSVDEKVIREVPAASLDRALQGRVAGVQIQSSSNQPGGGTQIRIRGIRSISGSNDPFIVLDGIPYEGNLNDINSEDIASLDVLKDASATAIYGSRGANGVILITTKRGKSGKASISYNGYHGIGKAFNPYPVYDATEYQAMRNASTWSLGYLPDEIQGMADGTNTNWQDVMYQNANRADHNISVTGGANGSNYSLGAGYFNETTLMPGEEFKRFTARATLDIKLSNKAKIGLTSLTNYSINEGSQFVSGSAMFSLLAITPLTKPRNADGSINNIPWGNVDDVNGNSRYSPLYLYENEGTWVDENRRIRNFTTLYGEYEFIKGLKYRVNAGVNLAQSRIATFVPGDEPTAPSYFRPAQGNQASVNNSEFLSYTVEHLLYWDKTFGDHRFNVTGMTSTQKDHSNNTYIRKDSIDANFVQWYNLAMSQPVSSLNTLLGGGESTSGLVSYMARLNYGYKDKYILTGTIRHDKSSRLAPGNQGFTYPAIALGWNVSEEDFMMNLTWIDNLKLRAGYGITSNQAIAPYSSLGRVSNSSGNNTVISYNWGQDQIVTGYGITALPNSSLKWEFSRNYNVGIDFGLFNNRLTGSIDWYDVYTNNILYSVTLPVTSGVAGGYTSNVGAMSNKGIEFNLSSENIVSPSGFSWYTDFNIYHNKNRIEHLSNNVERDIANQLHKGYSMTAIFDYNKLGIWQQHEALEAAQYGSIPGQLKLEDINKDGVINEADRRVIGDGDARWQGGLTNRFAYKGWDLSIVMTGRFGGNLVSTLHQPNAAYITALDGRRNQLKVDYWTPNNPTNWFPAPQTQISPVSDAWRTLGYYDASYVKLRNISLGYTFSKGVVDYLKVQSIRLYFNADNLAVLYSPFYKLTGVDPEGTGTGYQGVGSNYNLRNNNGGNGFVTIGLSTPSRKTFTFGAVVKF